MSKREMRFHKKYGARCRRTIFRLLMLNMRNVAGLERVSTRNLRYSPAARRAAGVSVNCQFT